MTPDVDRRIAPKKANIADDAADVIKIAALRLPRLWTMIILGILSWLLIIFLGWVVYSTWIAPAALAG